jgi:dCMP deaminase
MDNWTDYLFGFAAHAALKSKDSTQVGAVLVGPEGEVRLTAFNGPPRGVQDLPDRRERPRKYLFASHAEANLISFAAREGIRTKGCTVYVTHHPCSACARTLIQAGVTRVVVGDGTTNMPAEEFEAAGLMCREAGLTVVGLETQRHFENRERDRRGMQQRGQTVAL